MQGTEGAAPTGMILGLILVRHRPMSCALDSCSAIKDYLFILLIIDVESVDDTHCSIICMISVSNSDAIPMSNITVPWSYVHLIPDLPDDGGLFHVFESQTSKFRVWGF